MVRQTFPKYADGLVEEDVCVLQVDGDWASFDVRPTLIPRHTTVAEELQRQIYRFIK